MKIGLHARNGEFEPSDIDMIRAAKIETLFIMSNINIDTVVKLRELYPNLKFITRLYDNRFGTGHHPTPVEFADKMIPVIANLSPYCTEFQIHNEPNHPSGVEGWFSDEASAMDFDGWLLQVLDYLKDSYPKIKLGFPGLAIPHNDLKWLEICRTSIERCDWLGVHCYWQNPFPSDYNHLSLEWGLRFEQYHQLYPEKPIHITECGNSNHQNGYALSDDQMARELVEYYESSYFYPYIGSVCPFIASSPDTTWQPFSWRYPDGMFKIVVSAVGNMERYNA